MNSDDNIIKLDLPAAPQYLSILSTVIEMYLATVPDVVDREITLYNVKLAAQECCTNIIDTRYRRSCRTGRYRRAPIEGGVSTRLWPILNA
jgi:hypothetical protein